MNFIFKNKVLFFLILCSQFTLEKNQSNQWKCAASLIINRLQATRWWLPEWLTTPTPRYRKLPSKRWEIQRWSIALKWSCQHREISGPRLQSLKRSPLILGPGLTTCQIFMHYNWFIVDHVTILRNQVGHWWRTHTLKWKFHYRKRKFRQLWRNGRGGHSGNHHQPYTSMCAALVQLLGCHTRWLVTK